MMIYSLTAIIALETVLLIASLYYNIKFGIRILNMQDSIEETLDILDEREESISKVLEIPLFYDSPEIKRVHDDIKRSRQAIFSVANVLVDSANNNTVSDMEFHDAEEG
jgi:hypothetical protein